MAVALGFVGIVMIIRPSEQLFTQTGNFIALASGIFLAIAYLLMKLLTATDPAERIIFYYLAIGTLFQIPFLFFAEAMPPKESCFWACSSGIILLLAQLFLVRAYTYAEASQVGIYQYATIVFIGVLNWIIWGEVPSLIDLVGVILVAIAGIMIIRNSSTPANKVA
jgi:drug/metabolite transporter (DMT)-like permease